MPISDLKIQTRQDLYDALVKNTGLLIIKFGATWCAPCRKIEHDVHHYMEIMPANATCVVADIDESTDLYAFLKSKKIVNGIPVILAYENGNLNFVPDVIHVGSDKLQVNQFFEKCFRLCQ